LLQQYDQLWVNGEDTNFVLPEPNRYLKYAGLDNLTEEQLTRPLDFPALFAQTGMFWVNLMTANGYGGINKEWKHERLLYKVRLTSFIHAYLLL